VNSRGESPAQTIGFLLLCAVSIGMWCAIVYAIGEWMWG
jgi:hypothetical protein